MTAINLSTLTWTLIGLYLIYLVSQDESVATWLVLLSKSVGIWVQRRWFLIRYNPDSPWVRYEINRNARRLADEILKENKSR